MQHTPWTKKNSSFPSDRIKPTGKTPNVAKSKGKGNQHLTTEPPKSQAVRKLETLLGEISLSNGNEKDPKGGCFCLARKHTLSPYLPICHSCGLILCNVNNPRYCCPHCSNVLLTSSIRETIISQLESEVLSTIATELEAKEKAIAEAQRIAGAFPQLPGTSSSRPPSAHQASAPPSRQTHKVMSLAPSGKSRRVVVSSYTTSPITSRPGSINDEIAEEPERVPHPPDEPVHASVPPKSSRPWENLIDEAVPYQPKSRLDDETTPKGPSRRKRQNKGKGKEDQAKMDGRDITNR